MNTSSAGIELIKKYEGLVTTAYPDPASGGDPYTIGYGHTSLAGPPKVVKGMKISDGEATQILASDLRKFEDELSGMLKRTPTQHQFDAMVSLLYNIGAKNFRTSTVLRKFNSGDMQGAANGFMLFTKAAGKEMKGLIYRRTAEKELFLSDTLTENHIEPVSAKPDQEDIIVERTPVVKSKRVWTSVMGWLAGAGGATFASFSGFDWRTMAVLAIAVAVFVMFFWFVYRDEIKKGLFS